MRAIFGSVVWMAIIAGAATAADIPVKASPPPAAIFIWTGWYVGVNAGAQWGHGDVELSNPGPGWAPTSGPFLLANGSARLSDRGFTGGAQAGYNHQVGNAVFGLEVDGNYLGFKGHRNTGLLIGPAPLVDYTEIDDVKANWLITVRPRAGLAFGRVFIYETAGLAIANVKFSQLLFPNTTSRGISNTQLGWTAGGGVELALGGQWSVKAEYLYVDLGRLHYSQNFVPSNPPLGFSTDHTARLKMNIARAGINYRFAGQ